MSVANEGLRDRKNTIHQIFTLSMIGCTESLLEASQKDRNSENPKPGKIDGVREGVQNSWLRCRSSVAVVRSGFAPPPIAPA